MTLLQRSKSIQILSEETSYRLWKHGKISRKFGKVVTSFLNCLERYENYVKSLVQVYYVSDEVFHVFSVTDAR